MSDIVERLRNIARIKGWGSHSEAADEILRLRSELEQAQHKSAAAPDLYAALDSLLKTFVDDLGECGYEEDDIADHDGVKRATAALRKARGET